MKRENLKKRAAELGYNIGFGARRHFATYDIAEKVPTYFGVITFAFGIIFLKYPNTFLADLAAVLTSIVGFAIVYLNFYSPDKDRYIEVGKKLNTIYGSVRSIYDKVQACPEHDLVNLEAQLDSFNDELQKCSIHKQVFFSNELAHFKLFGESQSDWFVKELKLTFFKDKIPAIWRFYFAITLILVIGFICFNSSTLLNAIECMRTK